MMTTNFDFITDEEFRETLEKDYAEMIKAFDAKAWKATHVLSGSIAEALLIDSLISSGHSSKEEALKLDLGKAVSLSKDNKLISQKTADLTSAIKGYRNLIHPGRSIRLKEKISDSSAEVAKALITIIVDEVAKKKRDQYGYTAEQIATKMENDSSAIGILSHLLNKSNAHELERLMTKILPERYVFYKSQPEGAPEHVFESLETCFRAAFGKAPDQSKQRIAAWFVRLFSNESDDVISSYGITFFRCEDLANVTKENATMTKQYLLSRLDKDKSSNLLNALKGIGAFIEADDIQLFVDGLISPYAYSKSQVSAERLKDEWVYLDKKMEQLVLKRIDDWINHLNERDRPTIAEKIEKLKNELENYEIPF